MKNNPYIGLQYKTMFNNFSIYYGTGYKDDWLVCCKNFNGEVDKPKDTDNLTNLKAFADIYGTDEIMKDFCYIFKHTNGKINDDVIKNIRKISNSYGWDKEEIERLFIILYLCMTSEFYYVCSDGTPSKTKANIKFVSIVRFLYLDYGLVPAITFTRTSSRTINNNCRKYINKLVSKNIY